MTPLNRHLGSRIRYRREFLRLASEKLAYQLGMSVAALAAMERGEQRVRPATLFELTGLLGVSLRYFFDGPYDVTAADVKAATMNLRWHDNDR